MARKNKVGIPYFSFDTDFFEDPKIKMLISKYGSDGITSYLKIVSTGYKESGYYLSADEDTLLILCGEMSLPYDKFIEIIEFMCNKNLFDVTQKKENNILTSVRMQQQYLLGTERREEISFKSKYLLIDPVEEKRKTHKAKILVDGKCITETNEMYNNEDKMYISGTQSKVKSESESKVKYKESKEVVEPQKSTFFNSHFGKIKSLFREYTKIPDPNEKTHLTPIAEFYSKIPEHLTENDIQTCIEEAFKSLNRDKGVKMEFLTSNIQSKISARWEEKLKELKEIERIEAEKHRKERENREKNEEQEEKRKLSKKYREFYEQYPGAFSRAEQEAILRLCKENKVFQLGVIIEPKMQEFEANQSSGNN